MQQLQTQKIYYNYLNRNYQPTWADTIDNVYQANDFNTINSNVIKF